MTATEAARTETKLDAKGKPRRTKPLPKAEIAHRVSKGQITPTAAAREYECSRQQIYNILADFNIETSRVDAYKSNRADILADLGMRATGLLHKLVGRAGAEEVLDSLQPGQIGGLMAATTTLMGVAFDKERLERGQSTANVESLLRVAQQRADAECCGARRVDTDSRDGDTG